jgi:hypothetical protein
MWKTRSLSPKERMCDRCAGSADLTARAGPSVFRPKPVAGRPTTRSAKQMLTLIAGSSGLRLERAKQLLVVDQALLKRLLLVRVHRR